ncbi:MAG: hypothetical protein OQK11_01900 [Thiovulaceae bacterium]|nr:hypothetical protein [Sulfurimonadaceae bacterium]
MDAQKQDEIMSYIMNKLEEEKLDIGEGISLWHTMGLFIFSQLDPENKDVSKIYENIRKYLDEMQSAKA